MTSLTLVKRVRARPSIVFDAMTTAEGISHWWGPDAGEPVLIAESDPRPGGRYRIRFRTNDGLEHESSGEFLEVTPSRIVMSWRWTAGGADPGELRVEIALRAIAEGTEITFTHARLHDEESRRSHEAGWTGAFDKLEAYLAGKA